MNTETSHIKDKKKLVPKLRFNEFDEEWINRKLGETYTINAGGDIDKNHVSKTKTDKFKYPIYANARKNKGFYAYSDVYKVEPNTVTIAGRGVHLGIAHARDHRFYPIVRLLVLKPLTEEDIYFSAHAINRIRLLIESTGVPQLTAPQISGYQISLPSLPEQQKIASFLSAVDEKIQQLSKKKELLEQYKKGLMQQLFSGQLRFKDENGNEYPEWEEKRLGDMLERVIDNRGKTPPVLNDGYPMIEINAVGSKKIKINNITKFVSQNTFETWFRKYLESGDILFSTVGATAICSIYTGETKAVIAQNLVGLRFNLEESEFMFYLLTEIRNNHKFKRIEMGAVQPSIKVSQMVDLKFNVPDIKEQQKIASYLSSIDTKIENVNNQITQSQNFKKGLLQQMFV